MTRQQSSTASVRTRRLGSPERFISMSIATPAETIGRPRASLQIKVVSGAGCTEVCTTPRSDPAGGALGVSGP
jgi:hypothetical protein